eukprot:CAMPEP_0117430238 /NCGR_PEP_ID=MMETSP0758-20121206/9766_1 /TAXON_ID=63605 /ORGANISM="Percolomonas cosmopolitus, Strain AE-1 (ATCC 50343)" /LENGTH=317 /DNA_ID=CAMNT_0005218035 /DNA_START=292 /DNA_END=1242 /DNA_ORIENTATION=-
MGYNTLFVKNMEGQIIGYGDNFNGILTHVWVEKVLEPKVKDFGIGCRIDILLIESSLIIYSDEVKKFFVHGHNGNGQLGDGTTDYGYGYVENTELGEWDGESSIVGGMQSPIGYSAVFLNDKGKLYFHGRNSHHAYPSSPINILSKRLFDLDSLDPNYDGAPITSFGVFTEAIAALTSSNILYASGKDYYNVKLGSQTGTLLLSYYNGRVYKTDFNDYNLNVIKVTCFTAEIWMLTDEGKVYTMYGGTPSILSKITCNGICEINSPGYSDIRGLVSELTSRVRVFYMNTIDGRSLYYAGGTSLDRKPSGLDNYWASF